MSSIQQHIKQIAVAADTWLRPDNQDLKQAIDQTVDEKLFGFEDIKHRIRSLKASITEKNLMEWARRSNLTLNSLLQQQILCLHAGNLPLVGIQDILAVTMVNGIYTGKLSRKDPYLSASFLRMLAEHRLLDSNSSWSTTLEGIQLKKPAHVYLFSGSGTSVGRVKERLIREGYITENTPALVRTASFSMAYIDQPMPETMTDLTEAVFRYGGAGCRSVAIVVAPFHLSSEKCEFTDYVEQFWLKNPQHTKPAPSLGYRFALNKALGVEQAWLNDFLIEENAEKPVENHLLYWVKGDFETVKQLSARYSDGLQSVYSTAECIGEQAGNRIVEPLSSAQQPPIWWKPDQTDTIEWLQMHV